MSNYYLSSSGIKLNWVIVLALSSIRANQLNVMLIMFEYDGCFMFTDIHNSKDTLETN